MKIIDQIHEIESQASEVNVPDNHFQTPGDFLEKIKPWKGVLLAVLTLIQLFTDKRADERIDQLKAGINMFL